MSSDNLTIEEYIEAVKSTLQHWLDIHTNASAWAHEWVIDDDPQYNAQKMPDNQQ